MSWKGRTIQLEVTSVAHGGHCVARHEGRVVFVRHALPGETVTAVVTEDRGGAFCRADAVAVTSPSPDRVDPPCPYAGPGLCGGCDWQHASADAQRRMAGEIVREQLVRLGGVTDERLLDVPVVALAGGLLRWRTRLRYAVTEDGRAGFRVHRSHDVVPVDTCLLATPAADATGVTRRTWSGASEVLVADPSADDAVVAVRHGSGTSGSWHIRSGSAVVTEVAAGRRWQASATGFWQAHRAAPDTLATAALAALEPEQGETCLDLYAGTGLLTAGVAVSVGPAGRVTAVEGDRRAAELARQNLRDLKQVTVLHGAVDKVLASVGKMDRVVLDPPRAGAGADVIARLAATGARRVVYVACDPASLARDVALLARHGYRLTQVTAYQLFPMTHHVECVAAFDRVTG